MTLMDLEECLALIRHSVSICLMNKSEIYLELRKIYIANVAALLSKFMKNQMPLTTLLPGLFH